MLSSAKSLPMGSWKEHMVRRYAEPYQPTSFTELNSDVIAGVATAMIDRSWIRMSIVALHNDQDTLVCHFVSMYAPSRSICMIA